MESRDVVPSVDPALAEHEPVLRLRPAIAPRWLDVDTAAQYLCMTRHALYHQVARLQLPFVRHGKLIRFDRVALDRCLERKVKYGVGESLVHRVRGQEGRRATSQRDRPRYSGGRTRSSSDSRERQREVTS
jgi:excisionase family DNA binding protein